MSSLAPATFASGNEQRPLYAAVTRLRIEASGQSVGAVSEALHRAADRLVGVNGFDDISRGQEVYERDLTEPDGSIFAYKGRLLVHPAIAVTDHATKEQIDNG
jgi:hypothetical protein